MLRSLCLVQLTSLGKMDMFLKMDQLCNNLTESSALECCIFAPTSDSFSASVFSAWGYGGIAFLAIPPVMTAALLAVYAEEVYYILLKGDSKQLVNSLCWLLGTHPAIMLIGTIAIFVPRAVVYLMFIYAIFFAFAIYKYYYLIITFAGGTLPFVEKSSHKLVGLNQIPCCCVVCMPKVYNSVRLTQTAKWFIAQNIILTPLYGALAVLLKADGKLYSINGVSASVILSGFNAIATLMCMYGFKLLSELAQKIEGMEEVHIVSGKTRVIQLTMLVIGFEGMIFNIMGQYNVFPCEPPLNFSTRVQVIFNYAVVLQSFFLGLMARHFYRRSKDIQRQAVLNDEMILDNEGDMVFTAVDAYRKQNYQATAQDQATTYNMKNDMESNRDDASSTSA